MKKGAKILPSMHQMPSTQYDYEQAELQSEDVSGISVKVFDWDLPSKRSFKITSFKECKHEGKCYTPIESSIISKNIKKHIMKPDYIFVSKNNLLVDHGIVIFEITISTRKSIDAENV